MFRHLSLSQEEIAEWEEKYLRKIDEGKGFVFHTCQVCHKEFHILVIKFNGSIIPDTKKKVCLKCSI